MYILPGGTVMSNSTLFIFSDKCAIKFKLIKPVKSLVLFYRTYLQSHLSFFIYNFIFSSSDSLIVDFIWLNNHRCRSNFSSWFAIWRLIDSNEVNEMVPKNQSFVHKVLHTGGNDSMDSDDLVRKHYRLAKILHSCNSIS